VHGYAVHMKTAAHLLPHGNNASSGTMVQSEAMASARRMAEGTILCNVVCSELDIPTVCFVHFQGRVCCLFSHTGNPSYMICM
jgi:hypothetical protein